MEELFVRKDVLRDIVSIRGNLVPVEEGTKVPAMLAQFRHKETRQRIFCILLTKGNLCCIINTEVDMSPKPYASKGSRNETSLTVSRLDGKMLVLIFNSRLSFLSWQKCIGEVIAEVQCCNAMKPLSSGRLSATRMSRCINLCRLLTREAAFVQQVKRLRAVRHKVNETMKAILAQEGKLNDEDVRKVRSSCGFIRTVYPTLRVDPDLLFLTEQLQGSEQSEQDLRTICKLLLSVEEEDRAEFLRMVRRSTPTAGPAAKAAGGSPITKPVPLPRHHRPTVPSSPRSSSSPSPGDSDKDDRRGNARHSPCKSVGRNQNRGNTGASDGKDHGVSGSCSDNASPVSPTSQSQKSLKTAGKAKKTVTWDESVRSQDRPRIPKSAAKRRTRAVPAVSSAQHTEEKKKNVAPAVPLPAVGGSAVAHGEDKENRSEINAQVTGSQTWKPCPMRGPPAVQSVSREMQHSPIAKPVPTMVVSATSVAGVARSLDVHAEPGSRQQQVGVSHPAAGGLGAAHVGETDGSDVLRSSIAVTGSSGSGNDCESAQQLCSRVSPGSHAGGDLSHSASTSASAHPLLNSTCTASTGRTTGEVRWGRQERDDQQDQHRPLASCLSVPMLGLTLLLAVAALCTMQLAPLLSVSYSATHFSPGAGYSSLTVSLGSSGASAGAGAAGGATSSPVGGGGSGATSLALDSPPVARGPRPRESSLIGGEPVEPSAMVHHSHTSFTGTASSPFLAEGQTNIVSPQMGARTTAMEPAAHTVLTPGVGPRSGHPELHLQVTFPRESGAEAMNGRVSDRIGRLKQDRGREKGALVAGSALRRAVDVLFAPLRWLKGAVRALAGWLQGGRMQAGTSIQQRSTIAGRPRRHSTPVTA